VKQLKRAIHQWQKLTLQNAAYFGPRFRLFGIFAAFSFLFYYLVWRFFFPQHYENLALRVVGTVLLIPIIFSEHWPQALKRYLPYYWHLVLLYCLPFFFSFMLLKNGGGEVWLGSSLVAIFLMILLLDYVSLVAHFVAGICLALVAYMCTENATPLGFAKLEYFAITIFAVVIGTLSNYNAERIRHEQERAMNATASSVAHELRTPLLGIRSGAGGVINFLPDLLNAYEIAQAHGLPVKQIRKFHLQKLYAVLNRIDEEARQASDIIDMLLMSTRSFQLTKSQLQTCSMRKCVETALNRYPFSEDERRFIDFDNTQDFYFQGIELLVVHVLFNLIKNSLRHMTSKENAKINIQLKPTSTANYLLFHDTGEGIASKDLPYVFERFYSSNNLVDSNILGGVGLAFCRDAITALGGEISCESQEGQYCQFKLKFPI